jgi:hypothetical protein
MSAVTGTKFYIIKEIGGYTYSEAALNIGVAAARTAGIKVSQVGTVIDCPTLTDLTNLYQLFYTGPNVSRFQTWNTTSTRFKDFGRRAYFKVKGQVVQVWALVSQVEGKLSEGAGNPSVWLPVYCSFDSLADPVFDDPRVASLTF